MGRVVPACGGWVEKVRLLLRDGAWRGSLGSRRRERRRRLEVELRRLMARGVIVSGECGIL